MPRRDVPTRRPREAVYVVYGPFLIVDALPAGVLGGARDAQDNWLRRGLRCAAHESRCAIRTQSRNPLPQYTHHGSFRNRSARARVPACASSPAGRRVVDEAQRPGSFYACRRTS